MKECYLCGSEPSKCDRWYFNKEDNYFICRHCHGLFDNLDQFKHAMRDWNSQKLMLQSVRLAHFLAQGAPQTLIDLTIKLINKYAERVKLNKNLQEGI